MVLPLTGLLTKHRINCHIDYWHPFGKSLKNETIRTFCSRQRVMTLRYLDEDKASPEHHRDYECKQIPTSD